MKLSRTSVIAAALVVGIIGVSWFWAANRPVADQETPSISQKAPAVSTVSVATNEVSTEAGLKFAVIADPHLDEQSDPQVFGQTIRNIVSDKPAFMIDLGDTFMIDKLPEKSETNIRARYALVKKYYDLLRPSVPVFMVMGNHDGETGWDSLNTKETRLEYFPNQNAELNYYSFERGGALFVMLDPYSYTTRKPNSDGWLWTLGRTQYDWLKTTLEVSQAKYKFIFIHQLVGGDSQGRGGVEVADLYEWGGENIDGSYGFDAKRPGWGKPIHQLLVDNHVSAVFKGHDHTYVKQELDGIIYQTLPQPSHLGEKNDVAGDYGYKQGEMLGGSGYLRVTVSAQGTTVQFIKADSSGTIASSYEIE